MLAEILIFVPSIANFRNSWLNDRLASARTAALVLEAAPDAALSEALLQDLLRSVRAETIALRIKGTRRLLAVSDMPPVVSASFDLRELRPFRSIMESFDILLWGDNRFFSVIGPAPMEGEFVEIVISERPLRQAMFAFAGNILGLSLLISGITAALVFMSLKWLIVKPVRKLTTSISRFAEKPEDLTRLMQPSGRSDEIGQAETAVAGMQQTLSQQLKQKDHLASLGLAVSKINHDLRNMLSSAQLMSDRMGEVQDPTVQRFAPQLVQTLDRAIAFCQSTLAYGRAEERLPQLEHVPLYDLLDDVRNSLGLIDHKTVAWDHHPVIWLNTIPISVLVHIDPEHFHRICTNLCRNALQAMENPRSDGSRHVLQVDFEDGATEWLLQISDTGPGIPPALKTRLFEAFHGSSRPGGTGLGLAIAADLVRAHGGSIQAVDQPLGARLQIRIPKN